jgi:hypothetical protein
MNNKELKQAIAAEYLMCSKDPVYFMRKYCYIQHPMRGKIKFNLYKFQEDSLTEIESNRYNVILKSRQMGISTLTAGYSLWSMIFNEDFNVLVIATTQNTAKNLVTKVRVMNELLPNWLKIRTAEDNRLSLRYSNGSQIKAVSSSPDAARSEALSLLIIDEAAFIDSIDDIWTSAQQTLSTGGRCIALSTPNGTGNWFHKTWVTAETTDSDWNPILLHWTQHPDKDQAWRDKQDSLLGEKMAAQECDCDFVSSGNTVIGGELLQWMADNTVRDPIEERGPKKELWIWKYPEHDKRYMVSADVARGDGQDYSAFHVIDIESMEQVAEYKGQVPTKDYGNMLVNIASEYNQALLVIENANIGWASIQQVIDRNYTNLYYTYRHEGVNDPEVQLNKNYDLQGKDKATPGFTTSSRTRPLLISKLDTYLREKACTIRSKRLIEELFVFIWKGDKAQAQGGYNDDLVMSVSIGLYVRDTALKLFDAGLALDKRALGVMGKVSSGAYNARDAYMENPWEQDIGNGEKEDLTWLL